MLRRRFMTKVSVVLYYWVLVAAVMLFAKTAGLAENNEAIIKILIVTTILYVGVVMISRSRGRALDEKRAAAGTKNKAASTGSNRKKKQK
jgi:L-asparagine transporter-like permease